MGKVSAFLRLTRVEHSIMLVIAVLAAELVTGFGGLGAVKFVASLVTPILVSMGSFAINDYFDVEADKANGFRDRPIVSGQISKREAFNSAVALLVVGALVSALINLYALVIAIVFAALAFLYSYRLKDTLLVGNIYIAFSMVIPFIYGDFVVSSHLKIVIILVCITIFLSGLAREIHGMIRDREGDSKVRRSKNVMHYISERGAGVVAMVLYLEAIAISIYIFLNDYLPFYHNVIYILPIALTDVMLAYVAFGELAIKRNKRDFHRLSRNLSLAAMTIALLAYLAAALLYVAI
ncbi:MAG: UbiA family prenyltransferase [Candidatus Micrarchaeota archaeon]|nr:UbiA family prenyltransferase [Candidatus Micrarchaeota archaeon]